MKRDRLVVQTVVRVTHDGEQNHVTVTCSDGLHVVEHIERIENHSIPVGAAMTPAALGKATRHARDKALNALRIVQRVENEWSDE